MPILLLAPIRRPGSPQPTSSSSFLLPPRGQRRFRRRHRVDAFSHRRLLYLRQIGRLRQGGSISPRIDQVYPRNHFPADFRCRNLRKRFRHFPVPRPTERRISSLGKRRNDHTPCAHRGVFLRPQQCAVRLCSLIRGVGLVRIGAREYQRGCPRGCGNELSQVALGQGLGTKKFVSAPAPLAETKGNESPTPSTRSKARIQAWA